MPAAIFRNSEFRTFIYRDDPNIADNITPLNFNVKYPFPYFSFNIYRTGIIKLTESQKFLLPFDNFEVINEDYEGPKEISKYNPFPGPFASTTLYLKSKEQTPHYYSINLENEPKEGYSFEYYTDNGTDPYPPIKNNPEIIFVCKESLINDIPVFSNTGDITRYAIVSLLNLCTKYYEYIKYLANKYNCSTRVLDDWVKNKNRKPCWRTKELDLIFDTINPNIMNNLVNKYGIKELSQREIILYFLFDLYRELCVQE